MKERIKDKLWAAFCLRPQLVGGLVFALFPLCFSFYLSLTNWDGFGEKQLVGFENFTRQFQNPDFATALANTVWYTLLTVPVGIFVSLLVALALNKIRGKTIYRVIYYMPVVTSSIAVATVWLWILNADFGLFNLALNRLFGVSGPKWLIDRNLVIPSLALVNIWWTLGSNMILLLAGLQNIPSTYYEAAEIDGAGSFHKAIHITLPLLSPTTFFCLIMSTIRSFQVFDLSFIMTGGGPSKASYTLVYHIYREAFVEFSFGKSSATAVILFAIIFALTMFQSWISKHWVHYESY